MPGVAEDARPRSAGVPGEEVQHGRPDLAGPLANIHIAPNGIVTLVDAKHV